MRSTMTLVILFATASLLTATAQAHPYHPHGPQRHPVDPREPYRSGFTLELGIGFGVTHLLPKGGTNETKIGLAPLSLSLGGFVTPQLAIMFRMAGTSYFHRTVLDQLQTSVLGFYGVHVQWWFNRWLMLSGGPGLALYGVVFNRTSIDAKIKAGFGLSVRLGFAFATWRHHALRFSLELFPSIFQKMTIMAEALNFEWQYY